MIKSKIKMFKKGIALLLIISTLLTSCISVKVPSGKGNDYSVLKKDVKYTIHRINGDKIRDFKFIKEDEDKIIGEVDEERLEINKTDIKKVSKISIGKNVSLAAIILGLVIVIPAYVKNEPVGR